MIVHRVYPWIVLIAPQDCLHVRARHFHDGMKANAKKNAPCFHTSVFQSWRIDVTASSFGANLTINRMPISTRYPSDIAHCFHTIRHTVWHAKRWPLRKKNHRANNKPSNRKQQGEHETKRDYATNPKLKPAPYRHLWDGPGTSPVFTLKEWKNTRCSPHTRMQSRRTLLWFFMKQIVWTLLYIFLLLPYQRTDCGMSNGVECRVVKCGGWK